MLIKKTCFVILIISLVLIAYVDIVIAYPQKPTIIFDQVEYHIGDTVKITLHSESNIDGFLVNIIYGQDGIDYVEDFHARYITATGNSATISFHCAKGDTYITIEAWAFDAPSDEGGIPSEKTTSQVFVSGVSSDSNDIMVTDTSNSGGISINLILVVFGVIVIVLLVLITVLIVGKKK